MSAPEDRLTAEKDAMGCWLCEHPVTGSSCAKCGCLAHYPPHQRVEVCVHCGDMVTNPPPGDWWAHARRAPDGTLHTGKSRCQSPNVAYGHLAHPADVPCRADGPNPCLGASIPAGKSTSAEGGVPS